MRDKPVAFGPDPTPPPQGVMPAASKVLEGPRSPLAVHPSISGTPVHQREGPTPPLAITFNIECRGFVAMYFSNIFFWGGYGKSLEGAGFFAFLSFFPDF